VFFCAPGRIRTCDTRFRSGVESLPGGARRCCLALFPPASGAFADCSVRLVAFRAGQSAHASRTHEAVRLGGVADALRREVWVVPVAGPVQYASLFASLAVCDTGRQPSLVQAQFALVYGAVGIRCGSSGRAGERWISGIRRRFVNASWSMVRLRDLISEMLSLLFTELSEHGGMAGDDEAGRAFAAVYKEAVKMVFDKSGFAHQVMANGAGALVKASEDFPKHESKTAAELLGKSLQDPGIGPQPSGPDCNPRVSHNAEDLPDVVGETSGTDQYFFNERFLGQPDKLRAVAKTWRSAAKILEDAYWDSGTAWKTANLDQVGETADAVEDFFKKFVGRATPPSEVGADETLMANPSHRLQDARQRLRGLRRSHRDRQGASGHGVHAAYRGTCIKPGVRSWRRPSALRGTPRPIDGGSDAVCPRYRAGPRW
jgi:hypothetical protein